MKESLYTVNKFNKPKVNKFQYAGQMTMYNSWRASQTPVSFNTTPLSNPTYSYHPNVNTDFGRAVANDQFRNMQSDWNNNKNSLGISSPTSSPKTGIIPVADIISGVGDAVGSLGTAAGNAIAGSLQGTSTAGNVAGAVGGALKSIPLVGGIAGGVFDLIGGGLDALFGSKINEENVNAIKSQNAAIANTVVDSDSNEAMLSQWQNQQFGTTFNNSFIGKDGLFRNKAASLAKRLRKEQDIAEQRMLTSYENATDNINTQMSQEMLGNIAANGGIQINPKNKGKFTNSARRAGMGVQEFANHVLANPEDYSPLLRKRANFARNASKWHAFGGDLMTNGATWDTGFTYVGNGGSHESNPFEGVQMGIDPQGIPNLVEEGEVVWNDYVFSKRLKVPKKFKDQYKLKGDSISFAEAAKKFAEESNERPNDPISKRGRDTMLSLLMDNQEEVRMKKQAREAKAQFEALPPEEQLGLMQAAQQQAMPVGPEEGNNMMGGYPQEQMPRMTAYGGNLFAPGGPLNDDEDDGIVINPNWPEGVDTPAAELARYLGIKSYDDEWIPKYGLNPGRFDVADLLQRQEHGYIQEGVPYKDMPIWGNTPSSLALDEIMTQLGYKDLKYSDLTPEHYRKILDAYEQQKIDRKAASRVGNPSTSISSNIDPLTIGASPMPEIPGLSSPTPLSADLPFQVIHNESLPFESTRTSKKDKMLSKKTKKPLEKVVTASKSDSQTSSPLSRMVKRTGDYDWFDARRKAVNMPDEYWSQFKFDPRNSAANLENFNTLYRQMQYDTALKNYMEGQRKSWETRELESGRYRKSGDNKYVYKAKTYDVSPGDYIGTDNSWLSADEFNKQQATYETLKAKDAKTLTPEEKATMEAWEKAKYRQAEFQRNVGDLQKDYFGNIIYDPTDVSATWTQGQDFKEGFKWDDKNAAQISYDPNSIKSWQSNLRYMPAIGGAVGFISDVATRPDYSRARDIIQAGSYAAPQIGYTPLGDYQEYRPFDRNYFSNKLQAESAATRRALGNTSSVGRNAALLAADYNAQSKLGDLFRQAEEYNMNQRFKVGEFNRDTNKFNATMALEADKYNASARQQALRDRYTGIVAGNTLMDTIDARRAASMNANLTNLVNSLGQIGEEAYDKDRLDALIQRGVLKDLYQNKPTAAYGGMLTKSKRRKGGK